MKREMGESEKGIKGEIDKKRKGERGAVSERDGELCNQLRYSTFKILISTV